MPSNHLIVCHPLLLLPSIFPSFRVFSNESALCIRWPKYWSFSFNISPYNEYSVLQDGLVESPCSPRDSLLSLQCSAFFTVQLSHPYMTTGKTIALTRWTFFDKVMSLLFNMLSRFVIAFLPRSKCLLIMAAVTIHRDFGAQENKICHCFLFSLSICREVMEMDAMILHF